MAYKTTNTTCTIQLVAYRQLPTETAVLCAILRKEAGRCWTDMVRAHGASRDINHWLDDSDLRTLTKGGRYRLHSQSIQALGQRLLANVDTARTLRRQEQESGDAVRTRYPLQSETLRDGHLERPGDSDGTWEDSAAERQAAARSRPAPAKAVS